MASSHVFGSAAFLFTPPSGSELTSPFLLAIPLTNLPDLEVEDIRERWEWRPLDRSQKHVVVIETTVADLFVAVRYDDQPRDLRTLMRLAEDGEITDLQYRRAEGVTPIDVEVERMLSRVRPDRERGDRGEWEVSLHLVAARTDIDALVEAVS